MSAKWTIRATALGAVGLALAIGVAAAAPAVASAASPTTGAARARSVALRQAREFLSHIRIGSPLNVGHSPQGRVTAGISDLISSSWSGYADSGAAGSFTTVNASWIEPTAKCGTAQSLAAFWVGIDGISSADPTVEQDGTLIDCIAGVAFYFDWWETYPGNSVQLVNAVSPGDHIAAEVTYGAAGYTLSVTDKTDTAATFSATEPCGATTCENESAEWIAEAPCCKANNAVYNLTNFKDWRVDVAKTTYAGTLVPVTGTSPTDPPATDEITMVDSNKAVMALPGALNATDTSFGVRWKKPN
ncbi:MAG: G1 family glutamic endopeptidase [Acidimicrobiales bacterium]